MSDILREVETLAGADRLARSLWSRVRPLRGILEEGEWQLAERV